MPWRWGPPNGRHSCLGPISLTSFRGRRVFSAFIDTTSPLLLTSSFLSSCCPACSMSRRGDFFCLLINHTIIACLSRRRMSSSSARAGVLRFFVGFIWDRLPRACLPAPPCLIRLAITRHASRDAIVPIATLIVSPYATAPHRPSPRHSTRWAGRSACSVLWCLSCPHAVI